MCYEEMNLPDSLDSVIVALCGDYFRMREAARGKDITYRTLMEYRYYCFKMYDAAAEIVGEGEADIYIEEIGRRRGYAKSELDGVSEATYKKRKKSVKNNIARKLHMLD